MSVYELHAGDLEPPLAPVISDTAATFDQVESWLLTIKLPDGTYIDDAAPTVVVASGNHSATVTHEWVDGETDQTGQYEAEVTASWPTARPQTFPPKKYPLTFKVHPKLDPAP